MLSDRQKIDNAKKILRRRYLADPVTAGPLIAGKFYIITKFVSGDDFSNVIPQGRYCGTSNGIDDLIFRASGANPTVWTHASELREWKLDEIKTLAEQAFESAKDTLTIKSVSFEGGGQSGDVTFDRSILWFACEELIEETDPGYVMPVKQGGRTIGITVQV